MNKKAVELTFNTIVIIALALLVLIVLTIIFIGRAGIFNKAIGGDCISQEGQCHAKCPQGLMQDFTKKCPTANTICCVEPSK